MQWVACFKLDNLGTYRSQKTLLDAPSSTHHPTILSQDQDFPSHIMLLQVRNKLLSKLVLRKLEVRKCLSSKMLLKREFKYWMTFVWLMWVDWTLKDHENLFRLLFSFTKFLTVCGRRQDMTKKRRQEKEGDERDFFFLF